MNRILACLLLLVISAACESAEGSGNEGGVTSEPATALPYQTATLMATPTIIPALTKITLPTQTAIIYAVGKGDTLSSIAQRYSISLEALIAANPGVQPTALSVGMKLVIPTGNEASGELVPSPAPLPIQQARCWPESSGGAWCFALVQNDFGETLENLSVQFTLLDPNGQELTGQTGFALLDVLPPGKNMPIAVHFPPPVQINVGVRVQVLTAIRLLPGDTRYLPVMLENTLVSVDSSGRTAQVSGRVILTGTGAANTLWILAASYDTAGDVVGVRRWEAPSTLADGIPISFDFQVSSVGPGIDRVDFLTEARP